MITENPRSFGGLPGENMLAGVGGIDAVLLVIAADEGVMLQTREHLAMLDLLGVGSGLVVLSKADLVTDLNGLNWLNRKYATRSWAPFCRARQLCAYPLLAETVWMS
ncbi:MAG: GTP-binding protein [Aggregatilineales bacterium]